MSSRNTLPQDLPQPYAGGKERRASTRYTFTAECDATESNSSARITGRTSDLGRGGCYVDMIGPFPVGTVVILRIHREERTLTVEAQVVFSQPGMGMGLAFTNAAPSQQALLDQWIAELSGQPVAKPAPLAKPAAPNKLEIAAAEPPEAATKAPLYVNPEAFPSERKTKKNDEPNELVHAAGLTKPPPTKPDPSPQQSKRLWVGLVLAGALAGILLLFVYMHKSAPANVSTAPESPASAPLLPDATPVDPKAPVAPGPIATMDQLAKPWSAKRFYFRDAMTSKPVPAMIVRLPGGTLWAFSLREPFGSCEMEFVTDVRKLQQDYAFTANHPMVADPCNKTVFDLTRYTDGPGGLVRGEVETGPGLRPPTAIEVRTQNGQINAVRMEQQ